MKTHHSPIHTPLLSQAEINALIQAARPLPGHPQTAISQGARAGDFATSTPGSGTDLADLRAYSPGDDTRHIDWRASARSRQPMLRTWFSEQNHPFFVLLDRRAAMRFGSRRRLKVTQAARIAITLLARNAHAGREVGGATLDCPAHWITPLSGMRNMLRLTRLITAAAPPCEPASDPAWQNTGSELLHRLTAGAELVLISDFSDLGAEHSGLLKNLAQQFSTRAIQVSDPLERQMTLPGPLTLRWGNQSVEIRNSSTPAYQSMRQREQQFQEMIASLFHKAGIPLQRISTTAEDLDTSATSQPDNNAPGDNRTQASP